VKVSSLVELGYWPRQSWQCGHGRVGRGNVSVGEASSESQIYRRWWCLLMGSTQGGWAPRLRSSAVCYHGWVRQKLRLG
jgi:hypothetical protein